MCLDRRPRRPQPDHIAPTKYLCQNQVIVTRREQLAFRFRTWGGRRTGAGRPKGNANGVTHISRPSLSRHHPVHVTLRLVAGLPSLRLEKLFGKVQLALAHGQRRFGFRLVHYSVQSNHLHLIAEAGDRRALSRGMQGLAVRVARAVNRRLERKGRVFADRYHARALRTPRAVHFALRYVLLNARKHARPNGSSAALPAQSVPPGFIDSRSSAPWFNGFQRPIELAFGASRARARWRATSDLDAPVVPAESWLLRRGVRRYGAFDSDDAPVS
jgi:REP-associated tyrosine transposase